MDDEEKLNNESRLSFSIRKMLLVSKVVLQKNDGQIKFSKESIGIERRTTIDELLVNSQMITAYIR